MKFSHVKTSDSLIKKLKADELLLRREFIQILQDFKDVRTDFKNQTVQEMPHSDFSHKLV